MVVVEGEEGNKMVVRKIISKYEENTYTVTSKSMQFASPKPKLLHLESALQSSLHAAKVFFVPLDSK